ncbi:MAG: hypothetical protein P8J32_06760 [bacterium]|nr:hypothetical protein [bacterium]
MVIGNVLFDDKREFYGVLKMDKEFTLEDLKSKHTKKEILTYSQKELQAFLEGATDFSKIGEIFRVQAWKEVEQDWEKYNAFTAAQAVRRLKNKYFQMMTAFRFMGGKEVIRILGGSVISEEVVDKTVTRMRAENPNLFDIKRGKQDLEEYYVDLKDTYKLHKISKEDFAKKEILSEEDVYILEAIRESSGNHQYLFVDQEEEQCQTAIGAAGWTMTKEDGERMTRQEYIEMNSGPGIEEQIMAEEKKTIYYTIVTEKPLGKLKLTNKIKIKGAVIQDCVEVMLYNQNLIKEVMEKVREHDPETLVFEFTDIKDYEIVYTKDKYPDLFEQWIEATVEMENYELTAELRDYYKKI